MQKSMPKTNGGKVMKIDENQHENSAEINRKFIQKRIVCERCLMQNNVVKPMSFQGFYGFRG